LFFFRVMRTEIGPLNAALPAFDRGLRPHRFEYLGAIWGHVSGRRRLSHNSTLDCFPSLQIKPADLSLVLLEVPEGSHALVGTTRINSPPRDRSLRVILRGTATDRMHRYRSWNPAPLGTS